MVLCRSVTDMDDVTVGIAAPTRLALAANTYYTCYTGYHATPGVLAWLVLVLHVAAFPVCTLVYLLRYRGQDRAAKAAQAFDR